jgi:hypothetical protein
MSLIRTRTWLSVLLTALGLSVVAVAAQFSRIDGRLPGVLKTSLRAFASPGDLLWWVTFGGAFSGEPSGFAGFTVWVVGATAFWFFVASTCLFAGRWVRSRVRRKE